MLVVTPAWESQEETLVLVLPMTFCGGKWLPQHPTAPKGPRAALAPKLSRFTYDSVFQFLQSNTTNNAGHLICIKQKHNSLKIGKQARNHNLLRTENGVLPSVSSLLGFCMTSLSDPLLVNHQARLQQDISGGPKPAHYCTTTSLGTVLSLCPSTYFFKAIKCVLFFFSWICSVDPSGFRQENNSFAENI